MDNAGLNDLALETIRAHLVEQGLTPRNVEGTLLLGVGDLLCRCSVFPPAADRHEAIVPVGVELVLGESGRTIREMMVGFSGDRSEAVVQAMHNWSEGVFPPIHHAFASLPDDDPRVEILQIASQPGDAGVVTDWRIFLGPTQVGGWNKEVTAGVLSTETLLRSFRNPLTTAMRDVRLHWNKIYLARQPTGEKVLECKLDNEDWEAGRNALNALPLPRDSHFVHLRRFLVMQPLTNTHLDLQKRANAAQGELDKNCPPKARPWWQFWKKTEE
jgi:hypothetical protein